MACFFHGKCRCWQFKYDLFALFARRVYISPSMNDWEQSTARHRYPIDLWISFLHNITIICVCTEGIGQIYSVNMPSLKGPIAAICIWIRTPCFSGLTDCIWVSFSRLHSFVNDSQSTSEGAPVYSFLRLQECRLTNWERWQGASSTTLKQPTTTVAGEGRLCLNVKLLNRYTNTFRFLMKRFSFNPCSLASNQTPPLRALTATWSACLTKLPRCTSRWRSRKWRSCLLLDKGESPPPSEASWALSG